MTPEELKFWRAIKEQNRSYGRWRRQVLLGKYIVDFCCHEHRLVIEIDGSHHDVDDDHLRDEFLKAEGYQVLRYSNQVIHQNINGIIDDIIAKIPPPKNSAAKP